MDTKQMYEALYAFVVVMKAKLDENVEKGKSGWRDMDVSWLWMRAQGEMGELYAELMARSPDANKIAREAADVANFLMMIADKVRYDSEHSDGHSNGSGDSDDNGDSAEGEAASPPQGDV